MARVSYITIFVSSLIAGLFTGIGTDPNEEIAKAFNQVIDSLCPSGHGLWCVVSKTLIYVGLVLVPILVDVMIIVRSGRLGIISGIFGFSSGFALIHNSMIGAVLFILGVLFSVLVEPPKT